jgi:hypothetical protein
LIFFFFFFVPLDFIFEEVVDDTVLVSIPLLDLSSGCSLSRELRSLFLETLFFFFLVPLDFGLDEDDDSTAVVSIPLLDSSKSTCFWSDCSL